MFLPAANQDYQFNYSANYSAKLGFTLSSSNPHGSEGAGDAEVGVGADRRQDALQRALQMGYAKLQAQFSVRSDRVDANASVYDSSAVESGPLTAERVAGNILGFIERRLALDVAEGASDEALASRLQAGLDGFKKGFAEAEKQLEALGMLSDDVREDIGETYDRVLAGIDQLRERYLGDEPAAGADQSVGQDSIAEVAAAANSALAASRYDYARASRFEFSLTTRDGDKVQIAASSAQALAFSAATVEGGEEGQSSTQKVGYAAGNNFSLSVDGELDEGELKAINDLLAQVNDLADSFFANDLETAFQAALDLGYDSREITRYALNLTQVEVQRVAAAYQVPAGGELGDSLRSLGEFAQGVLDALDMASVFDGRASLLEQLSEGLVPPYSAAESVDEVDGPERRFDFAGFVRQMLDGVAAV